MSKSPDHMSGINALPHWDQQSPTTYRYDPQNYDRADYAKFKEARNKAATARHEQAKKDLKEARRQFPKDFRQAFTDKMKEANLATHKAPSNQKIRNAARMGHVLHLTTPSSCFDSVTWKTELFQSFFGTATHIQRTLIWKP